MKTVLLLCIILLLLISCHHNRNKLNTDEQKLKAEIEQEEKEKKAAMDGTASSQTAGSHSDVLRVLENRSEDTTHPPVVLDFISARKNVKPIKASDLFSKIEYIRIEPDPDSLFYELGATYLVSDKFIYVYSMNGIAQYSFSGHFVKYICKNESYYTAYKGGMMVTAEQAAMFVGARTLKLFLGRLYYRYEDRPANFAAFMEYDETGEMQVLNLPDKTESAQNIRGLGKPIMHLPQNDKSYRVPEMEPLGNGMVGFTNNRKINSAGKDFFTVTSTSGDTVCSFKDFDPILNYTKSVGRGAEDGYSYVINGILHLRPVYNDTIYEVLPPNRMIPKYIFDFGEFGIKSSLEGVDPGYSLIDKFVPDDFLETNRYLFFTYTKDYDCPNTAKNGTLKYSRVIYDKGKKTIIPVYTDETPFVPKGRMTWPGAPDLNIKNDIDNSPFLWPQKVTSAGLPYAWINGKQLKDKFKTDKFGNYTLGDNDCVIAIYK